MSRRRTQQEGSLELMLDTLCNTFGGIVFIALLVVLMLQLTHARNDDNDLKVTPLAKTDELRTSLAALRKEIEAFQSTIQNQAAILEQRAGDEDVELLKKLNALDPREAEARQRRSDMLDKLKGQRTNMDNIILDLDSLESQIRVATQRRDQLRNEMRAEQEKRTHTISAPVARPTSKSPIAVELRYNRLYVLHKHARDGSVTGPNLDDYFVLEESGAALALTPNPAAGTVITDLDATRNELARKLVLFPHRHFYLDTIVRNDSFESFYTLRAALSELGYVASLLVADPQTPVIDRGGRGRVVQ